MKNAHIEAYLDYYLERNEPPGFAVLIDGEWGIGKSFFIKRYLSKFSFKKQEVSDQKMYCYI